jgi:hypothetical protein
MERYVSKFKEKSELKEGSRKLYELSGEKFNNTFSLDYTKLIKLAEKSGYNVFEETNRLHDEEGVMTLMKKLPKNLNLIIKDTGSHNYAYIKRIDRFI